MLEFTVGVENRAGHKFPTGIPTRRAWLHVKVTKGNAVVFESGEPRADGQIAGDDAVGGTPGFEPHYDLITSQDQVQIYEPVMRDSDGNVTYTLLRAASYAKDNRLLPIGFDKSAAPPSIAVYGEAATDGNFTAGGDEVSYSVSAPDGALTITVRLLYQALAYPLAQDLWQDGTDLTDRFRNQYDVSDKTPKTVAIAQTTVN
jgi:hypothetical protein